MEEKEIPVADAKTGTIKKIIEKVPVTKNKVIPKPAGAPLSAPAAVVPAVTPLAAPASAPVAAPVAQNSTHEVVPVVEEETKEVTTKDAATGEEKKEVVKIPVTKNKVVPKAVAPVVAPTTAPIA